MFSGPGAWATPNIQLIFRSHSKTQNLIPFHWPLKKLSFRQPQISKQVSTRYSFTVAHHKPSAPPVFRRRSQIKRELFQTLSTALTTGWLKLIQLLDFMNFTWLWLEPQSKRGASNNWLPHGSYFFLSQEVHFGKSLPTSWDRTPASHCWEQLLVYHSANLQLNTQESRATSCPACVSLAECTGTEFLFSFVQIPFPAIQKKLEDRVHAGIRPSSLCSATPLFPSHSKCRA